MNHNTRAFTAKNVDKNRSADNVEFCQEDIKQVYHKLFDEARERYNAKQKRKDRMIDNYYEKIRRGKQEKLFHEVIFQIGNKDDMNARSEDGLFSNNDLDADMELHSLVLKELNEKMYGADSFEDYMRIVDATEKKQSGKLQKVDYYSNEKRWNRSR